MRKPALLLLAALAGTLVPAGAPAAAQNPEERAQLERVEARGRLIFGLDRAAWVATDDLVPRVPDMESSGMRGYVAEPEGEGFRVIFYGDGSDGPVAYYSARVENHRVVSSELLAPEARRPLSQLQRRLVAVRARANDMGVRPCEGRIFNTVVIPPDAPDGPVDLYLLTPQVRAGQFPAGGHHRFTLAADGSVLSSRRFANSCLLLGPPPGEPREGTPVAMVVTHLLDPLPTEIHVFTNLTSGMALYVAATEPQRLWQIEDGRISLVERTRAQGGKPRR